MKTINQIAKSAKKVSPKSMNTIKGGKNDIVIIDVILGKSDITIEDDIF